MENNRYRTILYSIGDGVIVTNENGLIEELNPVAEMLTGWKESDTIKRPISEVFNIINEYTREIVENPVDRVLRDGTIVGLANHTLLISKDGTEIPITDCGAPVIDKSGKICGSVLVFRDQTAERDQQKKVAESEKLYKDLFAATHDGICLHRLVYDENNQPVDYIILDLNKRFEEITSLSRDSIIGKKATEVYSTESPPYFEEYLQVALTGESCSFETYFPPMDKYFQIAAFSPECGIFATVFQDITRQKKADAELTKHRNHLEELVKERTSQLETKNKELEHLNSLFVGREFRIAELKEKIKVLERELIQFRPEQKLT